MDHLYVEWFAVWNRSLPAESKQDSSSSGQAVTSEHGSQSLEAAGNDVKRDDEDDDEESGILYKYAANQDEAGESLSRRIGLAQGLIDFASSFNLPKQAEEEGSCDDNDIRVVNSARQRMIFLQPEPTESYWIVCALPTSHAGIVHSRESSAASTITPSKASKSPTGAQAKALQSEAYVNLVKDTFSEFALLHGDLSYLKEVKGKIELQKALQIFFDAWCRRPVIATGLGVLRNPAMHSLPINDALLSFEPSNLLILSKDGILHLPDTSSIPHKSALAIARHLWQHFDHPKNTPDSSIHEIKSSKKKLPSLGVPYATTSTWKRSLSLGGIGGYIGLPGSNSTIKPEVDSTDTKVSTQQSAHAIGEKSWINPMNLFGGSSKAKAIPLTAEADTNVTVSLKVNPSNDPNVQIAESAESPVTGEEYIDSVTRPSDGPLTNSQMRRTASLGVSEALQAAIGADLQLLEPQNGDRKAPQAVTNAESIETLDIFVQQTKEWKVLHVLQLEGFTLAYVGEPPNVMSAKRIASACKKVLSGLPHNTSLQYFRTDSRSVTDYFNVSNTALSTSASAEARQEAASNAVADMARFSKSRLSELFVRTSLSTWLVARPARRDENSAQLSDIIILPKSIGKEGSLVDAHAEIQRGG